MPKICRIAAASVLALLALPSAAHASAVSVDTLLKAFTYKSASGEANRVVLNQSGNTVTISDSGASIKLGLAAGFCVSLDTQHVTCAVPLDYALKIDTQDGDDSVIATASVDLKIDAGTGSDLIRSGSGDDNLIGGSTNSGSDSDGDDVILGGAGRDKILGGPGRDVADYSDAEASVSATPDNFANDGVSGEGDNIDQTIEGAAGGTGNDTLVAHAAGGTLAGGAGDDTLIGAAGSDHLDGGSGHDGLSGAGGDDLVYSRDGVAESPICGTGTDTLAADPEDAPSVDCELVEGLAPGAAGDTGTLNFGLGVPPRSSPTSGAGTGTNGDGGAAGGSTDGSGAGGFDSGSLLPAPERGLLVNVETENGTVRVQIPGSDEFFDLAGDSGIPVGSVIDATNGTISITSALDANGNTQTATFWGGVFRIRQRRNSPVVDIILKGGDFSSCPRQARAGSATAVTSRSRARRRLWSRDRHGRYRTKGRHSVATVRGTRWLTEDRCEGTLTRVTKGAVSVRALGRRKRELVRAGDSYLARRR